MADVQFSIERDGYSRIILDIDGGKPFGLQRKTTGLGIAPVEPRFRQGAGDGGTLAGERVALRPMDLGILVYGDDRISTGENLRKLANITRSRRNQPLPRLVASYSTGEVFQTEFSYVSGLELDYTNAMPNYIQVTMSVMSQPFWTAKDSISFTVGNTGTPVGLLPDLAELPVASSFAIGDVSVFNPGDYESDLNWRVTGPCTSVDIQVDGVGFTIDHALESGDVLLVDGTEKTVKTAAGVSVYSWLSAAPKFPSLQPGYSGVFVSMPGALNNVSSVTGYFKPRRELVF